MRRGWLIAAGQLAIHRPRPPPTHPARRSRSEKAVMKVHLAVFGDVTLADGEVVVMDGGIHGVQGHTVRLSASGQVSWERRLDSFAPASQPGSGTLALSQDELVRWKAWHEALWALAPKGSADFSPPISQGPPRWVWAVAMRRGDEVRTLSGGGMTSPAGAPQAAARVLAWMEARVDAAAKGK